MAPFDSGRPGKCDVMVSFHPSDSALAERIIAHLTERYFSVWQPTPNAANSASNSLTEQRKRTKALLDAKVFLIVVSQASLTHQSCKDEAALAYISGKQLIPLGVESYQSLEPYLDPGMKMLLAKLNWTFFITPEDWEKRLTELTNSVADAVSPPADISIDCPFGEEGPFVSNVGETEFEVEYQSVNESNKRVLVTLRRNQSVQQNDVFSSTFQGLDFWDVHFPDEPEVKVAELAATFVREYEERLAYHVSDLLKQRVEEKKSKEEDRYGEDEQQQHDSSKECDVEAWIRQLITKDLFLQKETVDRATYDQICTSRPLRLAQSQQHASPPSVSNDDFYRRVKEYAIGKLAMLKVFNLNSSVRLIAIQNLGQYATPEIVAGLTELLNDDDPNIRTVATLALGRCSSSSSESASVDAIVGRLLILIKDPDRLVRQAACISLGHLRAGAAVKTLVHVWRNEPISDVRGAAYAALERMEGEEAKMAIAMTRKLEEEMKRLGVGVRQ